MPLRLKDWLPKGLYWRTYLIIVLPVAMMQLIVAGVFVDAHWRATSKRMAQSVAGEAAALTRSFEAAPGKLDALAALARDTMRIEMRFEPSGVLDAPRCLQLRSVVDVYMRGFLQGALRRPVWYDASCPGERVRIRVPAAGGVLEMRAYKSQVQAGSLIPFIVWTLAATAALSTVSLLFIRNQIKPVQVLADAMDRFGQGLPAASTFRPRGAREVRQAGASFLAMRERIQRHLEQRTLLLAGVSHDLRTPLTRLRLQLAMMPPDEDVAAAQADLRALEETVEEYLAFASGDSGGGAAPLDVAALAAELAGRSAGDGGVVELSAPEPLLTLARPGAVRRALANLIDNARAHGEKVRITARGEEG
ncbi:MAG: HAMP domain-containing protein, partial [Hyphomonadaceae bacterium]|nr:HAMP domain-containing protein [Hyphomonadaceae bacterium]